LSITDVNLLVTVGFKQDDSKHSAYYYFEDDKKTTILIPQEDGTYKFEFLEMCDDGDGSSYEDFNKTYSKTGQTLQQFIEEWF
jgi:hypothetical protein